MRRFRAIPVERKLMLMMLFVTSLTLVLAYAGLFFYELRAMRSNLERNLRTLAEVIGSNCTAVVEFDDQATAYELLSALKAEPQIRAGAIYRTDGVRLTGYVKPGEVEAVIFPPAPEPDGFHRPSADMLTLFRPIMDWKENARVGTIYLQADFRQMWEQLRISAMIDGLVLLAAFLIAFQLAGRLRRFISEPILALGKTARAVSQERNYGLRAEKQTQDEIGDLIDRFNEMLTQIETRDTALQQTHRELAEANRVLEQQKAAVIAASKAKDQFLAMLSHELRTPLTPVLASIDSLQNGAKSGEAAGIVEMIRRNIQLEARLIDDLLDITRIAKGKLQLNLEEVDAAECIRRVLEMLQRDLAAKGLKLTLELRAENHWMKADSAKLQQIIWNLFRNAIKFTDHGGRISVSTLNEAPGSLTIRVRDTGLGIAPEVLGRIFDPFEQGERSIQPRFGGLGLGLSISKGLAEAQQGTLTAASAGHGEGAAFSLVFPTIAASSRDLQPGPARETPPVRLASPLVRPRILLVEDHDDTRDALNRLLTKRGYSVVVAHNVREGIELGQGSDFEILISDIGLPDGSGVDIIRALRNSHPLKGIALSGLGMESDIRNSKAAGFSEHLIKPVEVEQLDAAIRRILAV